MPVITTRGTSAIPGATATWANTANAIDAGTGTLATWTNATKLTVGNLEITYDFSAIPAGSTINSITVNYRHSESSTTLIAGLVIEPWSGGFPCDTAQNPARNTALTTTVHTFTGITADELRNSFSFKLNATKNTTNSSSVWSVDYVEVVVDYTAPVVTVELWEAGNFIRSLGTATIAGSGVLEFTFDAAELASITGKDVEVRLSSTGPANIQAVQWVATETNVSNDVIYVELWENGSKLADLGSYPRDSLVHEFTWNASLLSSTYSTNVEIRLWSPLSASIQAVEWQAITLPAVTQTGDVALNAPGNLSSGASVGAFGALNLNAPGSLSSTAPVVGRFAAANLNAPGTLTSAGTRTTTGAIVLNAPGALIANVGQAGSATLSAPGNLTAGATQFKVVAATLGAPGVLSTGATRDTTASLALSGPGALSVTANRTTTGVVVLSAPGSISAGAVRATTGALTLSAPGTLTSTTSRITFGAINLNAPAALTSTGQRGQTASVTLNAPGNLATAASRTTFAAVALTAPGRLTSNATQLMVAGVILSGPGSISTNPVKLLIKVRSPITGQLVPAIVRVRRHWQAPFMVPDVHVRATPADPFERVQIGALFS